jgi:vacuolar-type H+-ATPase subunit F/Vma7
MNRTEILVAGRNQDSVDSIVELMDNNNDWVFMQAATDEEAIEKFHQRNFDIVLITDGITDDEERKLRKVFTIQNPDIIILKHYSNEGNLLTDEINAALEKQRKDKKPLFSFVDDALKNAGLNITVQ